MTFFYNTIQYHCSLTELSLQSSEVHTKVEQSLGFFSSEV